MPKAIRLYEHGGAELLKWQDVDLPPLGPRDVLVRHSAIGVNFSDVYLRTGLYARALPSGVGTEAAGVIEQMGRGVRGWRRGDRVAYYYPATPDAYSTARVLPADALVKIPTGVSDEQAAAILLKGLTCWFLLRETHRVRRGEVLLVPAAAGGVGLILCQWARALGARVIGAVGSADKVKLATRHGCHHVLVGYQDLAARARALNRGKGMDVVYDGVGRQTFQAALESLRPRGLLVSFGNASGAVEPLAPLELARRGSLFLTRPTMGDYVGEPQARRRAARELFRLVNRGSIRVHIGQHFRLADAAQAQRALEERRTTGSTVLLP